MMTGVLKKGIRPRRRARARRYALVCAALVAVLFMALPASAQLPLDIDLDVPTLTPLPLPTITVEEPVTTTLEGVVGTVTGVPEQLGGIVGGVEEPPPGTVSNPAVPVRGPRVDSWSLDVLPGLRGAVPARIPASVSSTRLGRSGSYTSLVGSGLRAAAGRAANLAGPLAAPLAVAVFALVMLGVAARGPGTLVKVEEERQAYRDRRSFRL